MYREFIEKRDIVKDQAGAAQIPLYGLKDSTELL